MFSLPNRFETVPEARENRQFPGGDVEDGAVTRAHSVLYNLVLDEDGDKRDQSEHFARLKMLRARELFTWRIQQQGNETFNDLMFLTEAWGRSAADPELGATLSKVSLLNTLCYIQAAKIMPTRFESFGDELLTMGAYGGKEIDQFAGNAWTLMEQVHPNVYRSLAPFARHIAEVYEVHDQEGLTLLDASAALPYLMAGTTRMSGYLKRAMDTLETKEDFRSSFENM